MILGWIHSWREYMEQLEIFFGSPESVPLEHIGPNNHHFPMMSEKEWEMMLLLCEDAERYASV